MPGRGRPCLAQPMRRPHGQASPASSAPSPPNVPPLPSLMASELHAPQPEGAEALAHRLTQSLAQPIEVGEDRAAIGVSTGIAIAPRDGDSADTLLHHADLAVYRAKNEGRNSYRFYSADMGEKLVKKAESLAAIRSA